MEINTNIENNYEFQDIIKLFIPQGFEEYDIVVNHKEEEKDGKIFNHYEILNKGEEFAFDKENEISPFISAKSFAKIGLYECLSKIFKKDLKNDKFD